MQPARAPAARTYVLVLLTLAYGLNFLDRTIFNVLIEPIKREFALSDTMMGLLAGFGFVLFYSVLGMPIARLADRANRRSIVAAALAFWSVMTGLCGLAQGAGALALARVGVGEAAGTPASQSLIADLYGKDQRPRALGVYALGTYLGVFLGYFMGGWVNQFYGWRVAFLAAAAPGLLLAAALRLTVAEPRRGAMDSGAPAPAESLGPTVRFLLSQRTFVLVVLGFCLTSYTNYATSAWIPAFLGRVHHLGSAEIGAYAGTFKGLFGIAGTLIGGFAVSAISRRDDRWKLWAPAIASGLAGPAWVACLLSPGFGGMIGGMAVASLLVAFHLGPIFAVAQTVARTSMRAFAAAALLLIATCFGQGAAPLVVGALNDALRGQFGNDAVRYSLLTAALSSTLGALAFAWAAASIRRDVARAVDPTA